MAATLKFGNGNWATKDGSALAYNDENGNFKPLPFDFTRASSATVINSDGLIEEVGSGIPRIDFLGNTKGAMLLEPSSTNLITQSEAFGNSYWTKSGASIEGDASTAGVEQYVDGDFSSSTGWSLVGDFVVSGGKASITSASQYSQLTQVNTTILEAGKTYILEMDIDNLSISDAFAYRFTGGSVIKINTSDIVDGKFTAQFQVTSNGSVWFQTTGSIQV